MTRRGGFTLTEMLVVVALLAIFAGAALPVATPSAENRLDAGAVTVANALRYARTEAIRSASVYGVDFSIDAAFGTRRVRVFRSDGGAPPGPVYDVRHPLDKRLYDIQLNTGPGTSGVTVSAAIFYYTNGGITVNKEWIAFGASGTPAYYPDASYAAYSLAPSISAVTLAYNGRTRQVLVDPLTGRVTWN